MATNKKSLLYFNFSKLALNKFEKLDAGNQNLYITTDDKFVRDEYITDGLEVTKSTPKLVDTQGLIDRRDWKKIILTTDNALIEDGIQFIDNEFLEWFVKKPSCESVEVIDFRDGFYINNEIISFPFYKIIIPQEEPKQTHEKIIDIVGGEQRFKEIVGLIPIKETIEEAAYIYLNSGKTPNDFQSFIAGVKWKEKRSYSEEEVLIMLIHFNRHTLLLQDLKIGNSFDVKDWFEEFKKK
jgi:hypothetical protein